MKNENIRIKKKMKNYYEIEIFNESKLIEISFWYK